MKNCGQFMHQQVVERDILQELVKMAKRTVSARGSSDLLLWRYPVYTSMASPWILLAGSSYNSCCLLWRVQLQQGGALGLQLHSELKLLPGVVPFQAVPSALPS